MSCGNVPPYFPIWVTLATTFLLIKDKYEKLIMLGALKARPETKGGK